MLISLTLALSLVLVQALVQVVQSQEQAQVQALALALAFVQALAPPTMPSCSPTATQNNLAWLLFPTELTVVQFNCRQGSGARGRHSPSAINTMCVQKSVQCPLYQTFRILRTTDYCDFKSPSIRV